MPDSLNRFVLAVLIAVLVWYSDAAWADQIDGHWCYKDGRYLSIRGPVTRTLGGTTMSGNYDRHGCADVVPEGEAGAGDKVLMVCSRTTTPITSGATGLGPPSGTGPRFGTAAIRAQAEPMSEA